MRRLGYIQVLFLLFSAVNAIAQGDVVVHSDPRLSMLLKKNHAPLQASTVKLQASTIKASHKAVAANNTHVTANPNPVITSRATEVLARPNVPPSIIQPEPDKPVRKWVPVRSGGRIVYAGKGFRVQVYRGPDRGKAVDIKTECMRRFPGVRTYITYISPCFRVKIGDFRSRYEAEATLREANTLFTPSMIVPDLVSVRAY